MTRRANGEGSKPRQRKDGRWVVEVRYVDPDGLSKRATVYGKTAKEAREKGEEVRARVKKKRPPKDAKVTLAAFVEDWIGSTLAVSDRKASTKSMYSTLARKHISDSDLGRSSLDRLTPRKVEAWVAGLRAKGLSESTVRSTYTVLRAVLDTAVRDRAIAENPAAIFKRPKVTSKEATFLQAHEVTDVIRHAEGSRYALLFQLLANTGMRRGEALALRWSHVDMTNGTFRVVGTLAREEGQLVVTDTKTAKSKRPFAMTEETKAIFQALRDRQREEREVAGSVWIDSGFVFTTELGEPCDPRNALRAFKVAATKAGHPDAGLHTLRHSAASVMLSKGVPLKVVSELWGHSSVAITGDIYGHVAPTVAADAMRTLSGAYSS